MYGGKVRNGLFVFCVWFARCAYLNLLWILFTLAGLCVAGAMPATHAVFAVIRKWLRGEKDLPIFQTFRSLYREAFIQANLIGLLLLAGALFLGLDFLFLRTLTGSLQIALTIPFGLFAYFYVMIFLYIFPVYTHYQCSFFQYFQRALMIGLVHPVHAVLMLLSLTAAISIMITLPGLAPFFGVVAIAGITMIGAVQCFIKIDGKKRTAKENMHSKVVFEKQGG